VRLPSFTYLEPETLDQALDLLDRHRDDAAVLAGGTDLLVRMKKGLIRPGCLVSLKALQGLSGIRLDRNLIRIGARTPLADITGSALVRTEAPALAQALETVGALTLQHFRGTLGGNLLQDNRCMHYNQSAFHRSGRQPCHKDGGKTCYSRQDADRCYSTCQSDGATALMALGAGLTLRTRDSERHIPLESFYTQDGIRPFAMEPHELLTEITVPTGCRMSAYSRLAYRSAIDYPVVSAGVLLTPSADRPGVSDRARIVVGSMGRAPLFLAQVSASLAGCPPDDDAFARAAEKAMGDAAAFAVHNVAATTLEYRCAMTAHVVRQALDRAVRQ
jgi:4-hydroxybenzoyl-CoA reductase beta subunit